jgi:hypothetical protein
MNAEKREESKENPRAQKYILEVHWKFICFLLLTEQSMKYCGTGEPTDFI